MKDRLSLAIVTVALVACCGCPPPAFVGIPDACKRSDVALPLTADDRQILVDFLQVGSRPPRNFRREDTDSRRATVSRYGLVLDQLAAQPPRAADLAAGGRLGRLADDPALVIAVSDARAEELGTADARAIVVGDYVFAFYRAHEPATHGHPTTPWEFSLGGDSYVALTVCHRSAWRS